jgi:hypothetical protein
VVTTALKIASRGCATQVGNPKPAAQPRDKIFSLVADLFMNSGMFIAKN